MGRVCQGCYFIENCLLKKFSFLKNEYRNNSVLLARAQ